jgi:hypothetical protein
MAYLLISTTFLTARALPVLHDVRMSVGVVEPSLLVPSRLFLYFTRYYESIWSSDLFHSGFPLIDMQFALAYKKMDAMLD